MTTDMVLERLTIAHVDFSALLRIFGLSVVLGALLPSLYLCKCMLGIDVMEGPSPFHDALYWIVDGHAGQWRVVLRETF